MHNFVYALWRGEYNNSERKIYMISLSIEDDIMVLNKNTLTERGVTRDARIPLANL